MSIETSFRGSLFTSDFLINKIIESANWKSVSDQDIGRFNGVLQSIFNAFLKAPTPDEACTADNLIWPVLKELGWTHFSRLQSLAASGLKDIPDGLLFGDEAAKQQADTYLEDWRRYQHGLAIVVSKQWLSPLDEQVGRGQEAVPSLQILQYMRRHYELSNGVSHWGILTNGARWRLYFGGMRSVSKQFFEVDLSAILGLGAQGTAPPQLSHESKIQMLRVFMLAFGIKALLPRA
jgi:hypothetical protein